MSHMTLDDRVTIQEGLDNGLSIRVIAKQIGKQPSTVLREIDKRKLFKGARFEGALAPCKRREGCQVRGLCKDKRCYGLCRNCSACKERCPDYYPDKCEKLSKSPYVCNGCEHFKSCNYESYYYYASHANNAYQNTLITAREGINQDPESLENLDKLISPLLQKGQSVSHVLSTHADEIGCSRSTIYRYVNDCVLTARNTDLPRKVKLKKRAKSSTHKLTNEERMTILSRNYERFNKYLAQYPDTDVVEMDTVEGIRGSHKVILTLLFRSCNLMLMFLLEDKTQENVTEALNRLSDGLGIEVFQRLFPVILTDRGTEFLNAEAIECDRYGEIKTRLFYCDPQCSWQKGALEKNHEFIRYVLPKGSSFDRLTQDDITLLNNHINSLARDKYHGKTPYMLSKLLLEDKLHEVMKLVEIKPDDVYLKPSLLTMSR